MLLLFVHVPYAWVFMSLRKQIGIAQNICFPPFLFSVSVHRARCTCCPADKLHVGLSALLEADCRCNDVTLHVLPS